MGYRYDMDTMIWQILKKQTQVEHGCRKINVLNTHKHMHATNMIYNIDKVTNIIQWIDMTNLKNLRYHYIVEYIINRIMNVSVAIKYQVYDI